MSTREEIVAEIKKVPAIPTAAVRVSQLLLDRDVDIAELARAIEHDPALTANVLRLANSAYFSGPRSIGTIREAIMRTGTNRILGITIASAVAPVAGMEVRGYDLEPGALWHHSVSVAVCSDKLIEVLGIDVPGYAFTASVLHDIGKIVLGTFVEIDAGPIMELAYEFGLSFEQAEERVLGISHPEVGALLLDNWNLPHYISGAVRWHLEPQLNDGRADQQVVDIVHAANALSLIGGIGTGSDGLNYTVSREVTERLGLTNAIAETVVCNMLDGIEEMHTLFGEDWGR